MDALTTIHTRQSIGQVRPDVIPRNTIIKLLEAAVQAPNHYKVRPWQFIVLQGEARQRLGEVFAEIFSARYPNVEAKALEKERRKPLRAPLIIAVGVRLPSSSREDLTENIAAAAAATQNLLLAAHALGLAAKWRTGAPASHPRVKTFLGLTPEQPLIGFIYIGYPVNPPEAITRPSFEDRTTWMT